MQLNDYFQPGFFERALERYAEYADSSGWSLSHKLELYGSSLAAFGTDSPPRVHDFCNIYNSLRSWWQVFRNGDVWPAERLYEELLRNKETCGIYSPATLVTVNDYAKEVGDCLNSVAELKRLRSGRPSMMAVSKFLHFFNPKLFPIYDRAVVRNTVLRVFDINWELIDVPEVLQSPSAVRDYVRYIFLANQCISEMPAQQMSLFAEWFRGQLDVSMGSSSAAERLEEFFATAFEFVAIGGALLELDWRKESRESFTNYAMTGSDPTLVDHLLSLTPHQRLVFMERSAQEAQRLREYGRKYREDQARKHRKVL